MKQTRQRRQRRDQAGHLQRRQHPDRRGFDVRLPRPAARQQDLHASVSSRPIPTGRSSTGRGRSRPTRPAPTIEATSIARRRWRQLDARSDRADRRRASRSCSACVALLRGREARRRVTRRAPERCAARRGVVAALALPGAAWAHAALLRTVPVASATVNTPPRAGRAHLRRGSRAALRDRLGHRRRRAAGDERALRVRSPTDPDTLLVPLKRVAEGWYLVYWRAISVDGHPVRGAFTFAVGPNAGPAPQFPVPSTSESAATPRLVAARWVVFLSVMTAIGLLALRLAIARPVVRRVPGARLRAVSVAFFVCGRRRARRDSVLHPARDGGLRVAAGDRRRCARAAARRLGVRPRLPRPRGSASRSSSPPRRVALWVDRPERPQRSIAELLATAGAVLAAAAVLVVPGAAGHAAQTAPRGLSLLLDWAAPAHGLAVDRRSRRPARPLACLPASVRTAGLAVVVPRFSNVALVSVLGLIASGTGATIIHMPTVASMWQTSYGQAMLVKIGLLLAAMALAAVNLLRTKNRLGASQPEVGAGAARLLRRLVAGEAVLVVGRDRSRRPCSRRCRRRRRRWPTVGQRERARRAGHGRRRS